MDCAAIDFGGSITDVVLRRGGREDVLRAYPAMEHPTADDIGRLLQDTEADFDPAMVAVTGGRSHRLPDRAGDRVVVKVPEPQATASGAMSDAIATPAIVVSIGTGTGMVLARPPQEALRLVGSGVGGGTLMGLARLLVGTSDIAEFGALARAGDASRCDLSVGDIIGQGVGPVSAAGMASHFGRLTRSDGSTRPEDLAAALVEMVGQTALRLSIDSVAVHQARCIVLVGHVLDVPGFREAIFNVPGVDPAFVHVPPDPGFCVARGALEVVLANRPDLAG